MSALQTQIVTEALRDAALPPGVFNIVTGRGETVGETVSRHPDVAKISLPVPRIPAGRSCATRRRALSA